VQRSADAALDAAGPDPVAAPGWWRAVRGSVILLVALAMVGIGWFVGEVRSGDDLVAPLVLILGPVMLAAALTTLHRGSRRRLDERRREARREELTVLVGTELDRRIGRPAREVLRHRAEAAAALTELQLELAAWDRQRSG
jgi:hypothetical protein